MASRTEGTRTCVTSGGSQRSTTIAVAPRAAASPAKSWPSSFVPGTQKKTAPGDTSSERYARDATRAARSPRTVPEGTASRISASVVGDAVVDVKLIESGGSAKGRANQPFSAPDLRECNTAPSVRPVTAAG